MVNEAVNLSPPTTRDAQETAQEREFIVSHRLKLKRKLLIFFSIGLLFGMVNALVYVLGTFMYTYYYTEAGYLCGAAVVSYNVANLHLLNLLVRGILSPPAPASKLQTMQSSNSYNEMTEDI
ncbi:MAG: hypothetical protein SGCHY_005137 [Lobulomycetales sp.]